MNISFNSDSGLFRLSSGGMSYDMAIVEGYLLHVRFGCELPDEDTLWLLRLDEPPFTPSKNERDKAVFMDSQRFEYPCFGLGDYRNHALRILDRNGMSTVDLRYRSHRILNEKPSLEGLPAVFAGDGAAMTLEITMRDDPTGLEATLLYSILENVSAVFRSVRFHNCGASPISLQTALSCSIDLPDSDYDMLTLNGSWARERHVQRVPLHIGTQSVASVRGESSHQSNPFFALAKHGADERQGEVIGFSFIYSGNFLAACEVDQHGRTRAQLGINPSDFSWLLEPDGELQLPEAAMVFSSEGLGKLSRTYHDIWRFHLIRSPYRSKPRPVLINNWEATYFDFDAEKLIDIAKAAAPLGIEMLVMDDGWFGHRSSDNSSLGDWFVNENKLKGGLRRLSDEISALGMKLGIWFEPEMVSPDSELFRSHPDWAIRVPSRDMTLCREQYVLDFSRSEVRDYIYSMMKAVLASADISYIKWDMNRQLTEVGSAVLPAEHQRELWHRYVLGVYELMERLTTDYPDLLLENCSGGGARFDPAMLYYSPQIWCSDDTDAIERLEIQYGTSMVYPPSAMGAHVSVCPNHACGRTTPFSTRSNVALSGTFGYELDITKLSDDDRNAVPEQIADYKKYAHLMLLGDYYRLSSPNAVIMGWGFVSKDKGEALFTFVRTRAEANRFASFVKLDGLEHNAFYDIDGKRFSGAALMSCGYPLRRLWGDYESVRLHLIKAN